MSELTDKAGAKLAEARETAEEGLKAARARASEAANVARTKASESATAAREKAAEARKVAEERARVAAARTKAGIESNPIVALAGGLAIGALAALLLPRTGRENRTVGKVGDKLREKAATAAKAARDSGKGQLDELGVNADTAKDQVKDLLGKLAKAATSAASAAGETIRKQ